MYSSDFFFHSHILSKCIHETFNAQIFKLCQSLPYGFDSAVIHLSFLFFHKYMQYYIKDWDHLIVLYRRTYCHLMSNSWNKRFSLGVVSNWNALDKTPPVEGGDIWEAKADPRCGTMGGDPTSGASFSEHTLSDRVRTGFWTTGTFPWCPCRFPPLHTSVPFTMFFSGWKWGSPFM